MNDKEYKASTHEKFRVILKVFYKVVYGNNEVYPDCVKWFSVTVGKEIKSYCNTIVRDNVTVTLTLKNKNKINNKIINNNNNNKENKKMV
jgi:hypothetical protein